MGRVGSCFDYAAAETFFSSLEWEVLSPRLQKAGHAQAVGLDWCYGLSRAPAQHDRHDKPEQLQEHRDPRPGSRLEKPASIRGNHIERLAGETIGPKTR